MNLFLLLLGVAGFLVLAVLLTAYICYRIAFFASRKEEENPDEYAIPEGEIYEPHRDTMVAWMKEVRAMPHDDIFVRSFDGLTLWGSYYEYAPGAPIEILFHGYRGSAERDMCGGVQRCHSLGHSALIVDQRACGRSGGRIISFGINESRDCLTWIDCLLARFGPDTRIILSGISMGAATVVMAAGRGLPANVIAILADCGYTSPKEIIQKVIRDMKLPPALAYPFVKLGAKLYGRFDPEELSSLEIAARCPVPIIFIHGENDAFVPCDMSRACHAANPGGTKLFTVPGAGHGLSYLVDREGYLDNARRFFSPLE